MPRIATPVLVVEAAVHGWSTGQVGSSPPFLARRACRIDTSFLELAFSLVSYSGISSPSCNISCGALVHWSYRQCTIVIRLFHQHRRYCANLTIRPLVPSHLPSVLRAPTVAVHECLNSTDADRCQTDADGYLWALTELNDIAPRDLKYDWWWLTRHPLILGVARCILEQLSYLAGAILKFPSTMGGV